MKYAHLAILAGALFGLSAPVSLADCTIYQHRDFGGSSWQIGDYERLIMTDGDDFGCTTNGHGGACDSGTYESSWNDHLSSFAVDPGCTITLWEHVNEGGARFHTWKSYNYIGDAWNDEVSEAYCVCNY